MKRWKRAADTAPEPMKVPGMDLRLLQRIVPLSVGIVFLFGPLGLGLAFLALLPINQMASWWLRNVGPPLTNSSTHPEKQRVPWILWLLLPLGTFLPAIAPAQYVGIALGTFVVIYSIYRAPALAALFALIAASAAGGLMIPLAASIVVMLARREVRVRMELARSVQRTAATLVYAALAFLLTLPFINSAVGTAADGHDRSFEAGDSIRKVLEQLGLAEPDEAMPTRSVQVPSTSFPEESSAVWPWILGAVVLAVAAYLAYRFLRSRDSRAVAAGPAASQLARLEAVGESVGRRRQAAEGALTYANALATHTGDHRLAQTGPLVSGSVYASASIDQSSVDRELTTLEATPPPRPPKPPLRDRIGRSFPVSARGIALSGTATLAIAGLVFFGAPRLSNLADASANTFEIRSGFSGQVVAGQQDVWVELTSSPVRDLVGWEACASSNGRLIDIMSGLSHRDKPLTAQLKLFRDDNGVDRAWLSIGTDNMTATTQAGVGQSSLYSDGGVWQQIESGTLPLRPYESVEAVLAAFPMNEPATTQMIDPRGDRFVRYESLPVGFEDLYRRSPNTPTPSVAVDLVESVWVLDIWTDSSETPSRIRVMNNREVPEWYEWRRVDNLSSASLPDPECGSWAPWSDDDWIGSEMWVPTRDVPPRIAFDDHGNPYDTSPWSYQSEAVGVGLGTLGGPIDVLSIGDLENLVEVDGVPLKPDAVHTASVDWATGADVTLYRIDGYPFAVRIDAADRGPVQRWDETHPIAIHQSFIAIQQVGSFPTVDAAEIAELLEPLWDGADSELITTAEGGELLVTTQSTATQVVYGFDADGVAALLIWDAGIEWRQVGLEGQPPSWVTDRESELHACLAGDRPLSTTGVCG